MWRIRSLARSHPRATGLLVPWAVVALVFAIHVRSPNATLADSIQFVPTAESLVTEGNLEITWSLEVPGGNAPQPGGHLHGLHQNENELSYYPSYPLGPALLAVPVVVARHALHAVGIGPSVREELLRGTWPMERLVASLVVAATAGVLYLLAAHVLRKEGTRPVMAPAAVALTFAFATSAWSTASRALWQHGPSMLMLSLALLAAVKVNDAGAGAGVGRHAGRWAAAGLGAALGGAWVMRPTNAIPLAVFTVWLVVARRRVLLPYLGGMAVVLVPWFLVNAAVYNRVLSNYYMPGAQGGGNPDFFEAVLANLVSPGRGLLVFSPVLGLAVAGTVLQLRRRRLLSLDVAVWATVAGHLALVSMSENWWGGHSIGPRLLSDMVPLLVYLSLPVLAPPFPSFLGRRPVLRTGFLAASALALVASVGINFQGATMRSMWCWNVIPENVDGHPERVWNVRDPQVLAGLGSLADGHSWASETVSGGVLATGCDS